MQSIPVITIDGPSASGKGTIAQLLAKKLKWHFLDSGVLYRIVGLIAWRKGIEFVDYSALENLIKNINIKMQISDIFDNPKIFVDNQEITEEIRSETCSKLASQVSAIPIVRTALLARQRQMQQLPGLVTDGRDMGTVVFPKATLKFYFQASAEVRAERRYKQLISRGKDANLRDVLEELCERDVRDANRPISPTKPAADAILIDTSTLSIEAVLREVYQHVQKHIGV